MDFSIELFLDTQRRETSPKPCNGGRGPRAFPSPLGAADVRSSGRHRVARGAFERPFAAVGGDVPHARVMAGVTAWFVSTL